MYMHMYLYIGLLFTIMHVRHRCKTNAIVLVFTEMQMRVTCKFVLLCCFISEKQSRIEWMETDLKGRL